MDLESLDGETITPMTHRLATILNTRSTNQHTLDVKTFGTEFDELETTLLVVIQNEFGLSRFLNDPTSVRRIELQRVDGGKDSLLTTSGRLI